MELAKSFEPAAIEARWYPLWERSGYFKAGLDDANPDSYCILLPPPNVTGTLHMGHAFQQTLMDALIALSPHVRPQHDCGQSGTDHAGIATQIVVERQLAGAGQRRATTSGAKRSSSASGNGRSSRARRSRGRCGASARPRLELRRHRGAERGLFTMDERMSRAVIEVFVRLHEQGLIYRGKRLVNWDPVLRHRGVRPRGRSARRKTASSGRSAIRSRTARAASCVATTRPETMLGDVAVAVHPEDERYRHLVGKRVAAAAHRPHDPGHRRRLRRSGVRHRLREDHAGARLQRLPGLAAAQGRELQDAPLGGLISIFTLDAQAEVARTRRRLRDVRTAGPSS